MAKENNEISDLIKKCKILLLDIEGTTTSISFVKDKLFPYAEENVKGFLESHWETEDVKEVVAALRKQATEDQEKSVEGIVTIPGEDVGKDEQIEGLVRNIKWQMSADRKAGPLKQLQGLIWKQGYDKGDIKGHIYDDVSPALKLWRSSEGQKIYIYSSGSVQAQKLLFSKSLAGDMLPLIDGHFDTAVGAKQEAASYSAIVEKIGCKSEEILFLTDIVKEAEAARASGLQAALVSREGNTPLAAEAAACFPVLHSFEQLAATNKRKPDPQVEEVPAKVPKTDVQDDVKTASETEAEIAKANGNTETTEPMETVVFEKTKESETMEVEETPSASATEAKVKDVTVANTAVVETKIVRDEVGDITEKDVHMEEAATDVSAVTEVNASVETAVSRIDTTENAATQVDTGENKPTVETIADKKTAIKSSTNESVNMISPDAENATVDGLDAAGEAPQVAEYKVEKAVVKITKVEAKAKMVDAATLTEDVDVLAKSSTIIKTLAKAKVVEISAIESKKVDAATETAIVEVPPEKLKTEAASAEEIATVETPTIEAEALVAVIIDAPGTEPKDMEAPAETKNVKAATADAVESNEMKTDVAEYKTEEAATIDSKTEEASTVQSQPVKITALETSQANTLVANGTDDTAKETLTSDSSHESSCLAPDAPVDEFQIVVESIEHEDVKAADKPQEMAVVAIVEVTEQKDMVDTPACDTEPVVEETGEKTDPNETEKIEIEATVSLENVGTVTEPEEPAVNIQESTDKDVIEVKDITDDKQSLSEVTDTIDDVDPIVEEPSSHLEEMEELQNAGDVLEKECDEILSKVQDVTNIDYIPLKPLHTIAEEMETENMDTNDMVERILDTEMELSMKPDDIDLNTVQEITETKTDSDDRIGKVEPGTEKPSETSKVEEKMEVSCDAEMLAEKLDENTIEINKGDAKEASLEPTEEKMETEEAAQPDPKVESEKQVEAEDSKPQGSKNDTEVPIVVELAAKTDKPEEKPENEELDNPSGTQETKENYGPKDAKTDDAPETKVNGKAHGDAIKLNGDTSKVDDLNSRLTAENDKDKVNGSNGDSADAEIGQGDNKVEGEIPDIKVKTVTTDEARTPIEQPVEA